MAFAAGGCYRVVAALEKGARVLDLNDFFYFVQVVASLGLPAAPGVTVGAGPSFEHHLSRAISPE